MGKARRDALAFVHAYGRDERDEHGGCPRATYLDMEDSERWSERQNGYIRVDKAGGCS